MNKICTSIKQSKKLMELGLSPDSADMVFTFSIKEDTYVPDKYPSCRKYSELYKEFVSLGFTKEHIENLICPCWSLAALMKILHRNEKDIVSLSYGGYKDGEYILKWCLDYEFEDGDYKKTFSDNPIDDCYEMIKRLNELNLV